MADEKMEKTNMHADIPVTPVQVHAQYIKDFSFENPNAPHSLRAGDERPQMDMNIVLDASKITDETNPDLYESAITLTVKSTRGGQTMFIGEVCYAALVTIKGIASEHVKSILYVDVPQMLFPFARHAIANAVASGGFPPLLLNPVDFKAMYQSKNQSGNTEIAA